jgi:hypothetical protein
MNVILKELQESTAAKTDTEKDEGCDKLGNIIQNILTPRRKELECEQNPS